MIDPLISVTNHSNQINVHALWLVNEPITSWSLMTSAALFVLRTNRSNGNVPCADHWRVPSVHASILCVLRTNRSNGNALCTDHYLYPILMKLSTNSVGSISVYWSESVYWLLKFCTLQSYVYYQLLVLTVLSQYSLLDHVYWYSINYSVLLIR